jgi:hypothetical protein
MTSHNELPDPDEPDPTEQSTPGGMISDLEEMADETGAEVVPDEVDLPPELDGKVDPEVDDLSVLWRRV